MSGGQWVTSIKNPLMLMNDLYYKYFDIVQNSGKIEGEINHSFLWSIYESAKKIRKIARYAIRFCLT